MCCHGATVMSYCTLATGSRVRVVASGVDWLMTSVSVVRDAASSRGVCARTCVAGKRFSLWINVILLSASRHCWAPSRRPVSHWVRREVCPCTHQRTLRRHLLLSSIVHRNPEFKAHISLAASRVASEGPSSGSCGPGAGLCDTASGLTMQRLQTWAKTQHVTQTT